MDKLYENLIKEVNEVIGVVSSYLISSRGEIIYPKSVSDFSYLTKESFVYIVKALGIFDLIGENVLELEADFHDGKLYIINNLGLKVPTSLGVEKVFLVVVGGVNLSKSHLKMALNVSIANLVSNKKYKKMGDPIPISFSSNLSPGKLSGDEVEYVKRIRELAQK